MGKVGESIEYICKPDNIGVRIVLLGTLCCLGYGLGVAGMEYTNQVYARDRERKEAALDHAKSSHAHLQEKPKHAAVVDELLQGHAKKNARESRSVKLHAAGDRAHKKNSGPASLIDAEHAKKAQKTVGSQRHPEEQEEEEKVPRRPEEQEEEHAKVQTEERVRKSSLSEETATVRNSQPANPEVVPEEAAEEDFKEAESTSHSSGNGGARAEDMSDGGTPGTVDDGTSARAI